MLINNKNISSKIKALMLTVGLTISSSAVTGEITGVDDLRESHKPALNYPQSVEWSKKRKVHNLYALRASDVIGRAVYNGVEDELGEIDDIIMPGNASASEINVIIEVGGFLGIGERLVAVPYSSLRLDPNDGEHVYYNVTEKQLGLLPEFAYEDGEEKGKSIYSRSRQAE